VEEIVAEINRLEGRVGSTTILKPSDSASESDSDSSSSDSSSDRELRVEFRSSEFFCWRYFGTPRILFSPSSFVGVCWKSWEVTGKSGLDRRRKFVGIDIYCWRIAVGVHRDLILLKETFVEKRLRKIITYTKKRITSSETIPQDFKKT